jgi:hypothetical protein
MANEWQRIAIRPNDYQKLKVLTALANLSRAANDKLPLADFVGEVVESAWKRAKSSGLVSDAMLALESSVDAFPQGEAVYSPLEQEA